MPPAQSTAVSTAVLPTPLVSAVDAALDDVFARAYNVDELLGPELSALKGPLDSVCKRHGLLIEKAIAAALASADHLEVMSQVSVPVGRAALDLVRANTERVTRDVALPAGDAERSVILDVAVFDWMKRRLSLVSVKRGGGAQGGKAARDDRLELRAAAMVLRSLMTAQGFPVAEAEVVVVDWMGRSGIVTGTVLTRETIDDHFGVAVAATVEAMTARFAAGIAERMTDRLTLVARPPSSSDDDRDAASDRPPELDPPSLRDETLISFAECLGALPRRGRGRQMTAVTAA